MDDPPLLGIAKDPWPYDYIIQGLQFFAMSIDRLQSYLPSRFAETLFHGSQGDFLSCNPLVMLLIIHRECVGAGREWNSWCESADRQDDIVEDRFRDLVEKIDLASDLVEEDVAVEEALLNDNLLTSLASTRELAIGLLMHLEWLEPDPVPLRSAKSMLSEWSYGAVDDAYTNETDA